MEQIREIGPLKVDTRGPEVILSFSASELDHLPVPSSLGSDLARSVSADPGSFAGKPVILDLSGLKWLNSLCLGVLVTTQKTMKAHGGCKLRGVSPEMRRLLEVTAIARLFGEPAP